MSRINKFLGSCAKHGLDTEKVKNTLQKYNSISEMVREEDDQMIKSAYEHASTT